MSLSRASKEIATRLTKATYTLAPLVHGILEELEYLSLHPSGAPLHTVADTRYPEYARGEYVYCAMTETLMGAGIGFLNTTLLESVIYRLRILGLDSSEPQTIRFQAPAICEARFNRGSVQIFRTVMGVFLIENQRGKFTVFRKVQ